MIARVWTDELPKCPYTSAAARGGEAPEDSLSFYCQINDNSYLYGVFEPHNGVEAARFILQRTAADITFSRLDSASDEEICELLRNAFLSAEKSYIENYDEMIAERTGLQYQLENLTEAEISQQCDRILHRLKEIDQHLSGGTTAVIALVHDSKLYVGNVGQCRALLFRTDDNSVLRVVQLSAEHSLRNEDELQRLRRLGVPHDRLRNAQGLGNQQSTRCLGNYVVKGLYRVFPDLRAATEEPVVPTPEVQGPIALDHSSRFLVLVSSVVYKRLQEVRGNNEQTNKQLAQVVVEHFRKASDFRQLSDDVLSEIQEQHAAHCRKHSLTHKSYAPMTLLIRNFNYPTPNAQPTVMPAETAGVKRSSAIRFNPIVQSKSRTLLDDDSETDSSRDDGRSSPGPARQPPPARIKGYVDFTCFYENAEKARQNGTLPSFRL